MKMEQAEYSETSAYKFQTPGNHPKESIQQVFLYSLPVSSWHRQGALLHLHPHFAEALKSS